MKLGYHRVSSASQSLQIGRDALLAAGVGEKFLFEEKESGKGTKNRPQLKALLKSLRKCDEVIVHKLDRLARNAKDLLTIAEEISKAGASLNILDLGINTGTPVGKMILTVLGAVGELERAYINDRTKAGIKAYQKNGGKMGPKRLAVDRKIKVLAKGGLSWSEIAGEVGCSKQTVYRRLHPQKADEHREADLERYYRDKNSEIS